MPARLVALDEGPDIPLDRAMIVVGRHPQCDARLDSLRVSRHHCCMTQDHGEVLIRDLGSTNGIRINGQRVEAGRLRPGDELSIAHIRYRLDDGRGQEMTLADPVGRPGREPLIDAEDEHDRVAAVTPAIGAGEAFGVGSHAQPTPTENPLAAAVRGLLPSGVADRCRIQVIVKMDPDGAPGLAAENLEACRPDSSP